MGEVKGCLVGGVISTWNEGDFEDNALLIKAIREHWLGQEVSTSVNFIDITSILGGWSGN